MTDPFVKPARLSRCLALGVALLLGSYLLLTSTVRLHETLWQYDVKRVLEVCLLPLILTVVLFNRPLRAGFQYQLQRIPFWFKAVLGLLFCLGVLSSVYNNHSTPALLNSLAEVALLSLLTLVVLCVAACRRAAGRVFDQAAILLITLVALTVGLQELLGVLASWNAGMEFQPRIALLHFSYPRFYNQVQTWSIPVIAALPLVFPGKPLARHLCVTALTLEWYVVAATGGRGSLVAVSLAILVASALLPWLRKSLILYQVTGLIGGLLIYALVATGQQSLHKGSLLASAEPNHTSLTEVMPARKLTAKSATAQANGNSNFMEPLTGKRIWTFSERLPLWRHSLRDAQSHPLLGIGPMNYACTGPIERAAHPHNFLLQFAGEWGIPALLLLLLLVVFLLLELLRELRGPGKEPANRTPLAGFLATALLAAWFHACLSGVLVMPASQLTGVLIGGWLLGLLPARVPAPLARLSGSVLLMSGLALSIAFLAFTRHELAVAETRLNQTALMDRGIPRLWQNGKACRLYRETEPASAATR